MNFARIVFAAFVSTLLTPPVLAAQKQQLAPEIGCIRTVAPGLPLLSGIPTGALSKHLYVERCNYMWLALQQKNGQSDSQAVQARFIPKYRARRKPLAIPDARVTISSNHPREAWLTRPTRRYAHGVLGDRIEAGALAVTLPSGRRLELKLPENEVFEDRMARLIDLDGDGVNELIVVRASREAGASLAVYTLKNGELRELTHTRPIGQPHHWLNPAAAADFDGDGVLEIAYVETPHIGGILKLVRLQKEGGQHRLAPVAELDGFSNHATGSRELQQAVTFDWDGDGLPDIILPGASRETLKVVSFKKGRLTLVDEMKIGGVIDSPLVATDLDNDGRGEVVLVTKDARLLSFSPD